MNIFVGNLSPEMTVNELQGEFTPFGEVTSVIILNDNYIGSGQTKAYGFVQMNSIDEGNTAITMLKGKLLKGNCIVVVEALPLTKPIMRGPLKPKKTRERTVLNS